MSGLGRRITIPRALLLVEIERRCGFPDCRARNRLGLTKREAFEYQGFECERCERRTEDVLTERDVPEWWKELELMKSGDAASPARDIVGEEGG